MDDSNDRTRELAATVEEAHAARRALRIVGSDSKRALAREVDGAELHTAGHCGIVDYEPTELVLTARTGTPLAEIEATLSAQGQMLGSESPHLGPGATLGGTVACGLSGPRRPYAGALRDFVLGVRIVNGQGQPLRFGGQVIKNVAGYDLSRLMVGAQGTLGLLLEVSLKVQPRPECEITMALELEHDEALARMNGWAGQPLPISAGAHDGTRLHVRLSGTEAGVESACAEIGGDRVDAADAWWEMLRERRHPLFEGPGSLWRLSLPPAAELPPLQGDWLLEWGGAQRWLRSDLPAEAVRMAAASVGGHATCIAGDMPVDGPFHPLPPAMIAAQQRIKAALDPQGILNPGRLYPGL